MPTNMSFLQQWMVKQTGKTGCYVLLPTKIMDLKMNANNCMSYTMYLCNHMETQTSGMVFKAFFSCT